ncbi:hypothetical protein D3C80_1385170 [compost metagenome]
MKFFDILYYYFYQFYAKILKDKNVELSTILGLSFSEALIINCFINFCRLFFFCKPLLSIEGNLVITLMIILANNYYYHKKGNAKIILKTKPKFLDDDQLSKWIVILFAIISTSLLFWMPVYLKYLRLNC